MKKINRRTFAALSAGTAVAVAASPAYAAWPERPITLIVPWGAGGGTDATARIIGSLLEKELGQPVNVVNRTGGSGVVGHQAIATAAPDGYTIGMATVEIGMMHWQGLTAAQGRVLHADRAGERRPGRPAGARRFAPTRPPRTCSRRSRPTPASSRRRGTGQGGIWHLGIAGMLRRPGVDPAAVALGADATARRPACRTSSPAASRSCPARCPRRAR